MQDVGYVGIDLYNLLWYIYLYISYDNDSEDDDTMPNINLASIPLEMMVKWSKVLLVINS